MWVCVYKRERRRDLLLFNYLEKIVYNRNLVIFGKNSHETWHLITLEQIDLKTFLIWYH